MTNKTVLPLEMTPAIYEAVKQHHSIQSNKDLSNSQRLSRNYTVDGVEYKITREKPMDKIMAKYIDNESVYSVGTCHGGQAALCHTTVANN